MAAGPRRTTGYGINVFGSCKDQTEDASTSAVDEDDTASNPYKKPPGEPN